MKPVLALLFLATAALAATVSTEGPQEPVESNREKTWIEKTIDSIESTFKGNVFNKTAK